MERPRLHGIIPPMPTPLHDDETIDLESLTRLVNFQIGGGVHGLWVLGTTARFDLIPDSRQRQVAETVATVAAGRVPLVLNVSDQGTERTIEHAKMFDDLPYDYYAALPPWYQPMSDGEVTDYFHALADRLAKPLVIYNAPWVCNMVSFGHLRQLAAHPRIVGCKDVTPSLSRTLDWTAAERESLGFSYLHGTDLLANSTEMGADGFVSSLTNPLPELAVAIWDAALDDDAERAYRLQAQFSRLARATGFGPMLACLEVICRHRGLLTRMLPAPLRPLDAETARRVIGVVESVGVLPAPAANLGRSAGSPVLEKSGATVA
jgi:dihydrodipicolinate synthase/N-acetylneuraminate lyase